jgi:hypothetical protein
MERYKNISYEGFRLAQEKIESKKLLAVWFGISNLVAFIVGGIITYLILTS